MFEMLAVVGACVAPSLPFAFLLRRWRPTWSRRRISLVSAGIVPGTIVALCTLLFVKMALTPKDQCGVDACAMGMVGAMLIAMWALAAFLLGLALAAALQSVLDRR